MSYAHFLSFTYHKNCHFNCDEDNHNIITVFVKISGNSVAKTVQSHGPWPFILCSVPIRRP